MGFVDALKKAMSEDKEIALPTNDHCHDNGYLIRIKPFPNNLICKEFYGDKVNINQFSLDPKKMSRNDWLVV